MTRRHLHRSLQGRLLVISSCLLAVFLAVAVNVATGGSLPGWLGPCRSFAWPAVGILTLCTAAVAALQLNDKEITVGKSSATRLSIVNIPPQNPYFTGRKAMLATLESSRFEMRLAGVHFFEGWVIAGCFGHAVSPRAGMLSGS